MIISKKKMKPLTKFLKESINYSNNGMGKYPEMFQDILCNICVKNNLKYTSTNIDYNSIIRIQFTDEKTVLKLVNLLLKLFKKSNIFGVEADECFEDAYNIWDKTMNNDCFSVVFGKTDADETEFAFEFQEMEEINEKMFKKSAIKAYNELKTLF